MSDEDRLIALEARIKTLVDRVDWAMISLVTVINITEMNFDRSDLDRIYGAVGDESRTVGQQLGRIRNTLNQMIDVSFKEQGFEGSDGG